LGEIAETAATAATSVINLKKARQKLRSNHRLFDTVAAGDFMTSSTATTKTDHYPHQNPTTGAISIIDGGTGELPKIKIPSHPFMSPNDEELLSSIATATSCSQKKLKSSLRVPLNMQNQDNPQQMSSKNLGDNSSLTNLTIETNDLSMANEVGGGVGTVIGTKRGTVTGKPPLSTSVHAEHNNSIHNNQVAAQSPNFIRDRYYQILREQVFPFLQKPSNNLNINQSPKEIQNYCNDVLY